MPKKIAFPFLLLFLALGLIALGAVTFYGNFRNTAEQKEEAALPKSESGEADEEQKEAASAGRNTTGLPLALPAGFSIGLYAIDVPEARDLAFDPLGNMLASTRRGGTVYFLPDKDGDGKADEARVLLSGLNIPHGLAFRCEGGSENCQLFVGETDQVSAYDYEEGRASDKKKIADLPFDRGHNTRSLLYLPDRDKLLVSVGSSCNVCVESDSRRATILEMNPDGSGMQVLSSGLRNSVFMARHPFSGEVWATEMGRDYLGDNLPPEEVNIIQEGKNYGWPYCYDNRVHDIDFDPSGAKRDFCTTTESPHIAFQAHSAPLGLAFFGSEWPEEYQGDLLVAYHGSWNRSSPTGYKIARFRLDDSGNALGQEDFVSGWLTSGGRTLGRPVDILMGPDRTIYISDDFSGTIYRMTYDVKN